MESNSPPFSRPLQGFGAGVLENVGNGPALAPSPVENGKLDSGSEKAKIKGQLHLRTPNHMT